MAVGLKFESASGTAAAADLSDAKIAIYEDGGGNKYILDVSSAPNLNKIDDIKLSTLKDAVFKYHPSGGTEAAITDLGSIIGALFATKTTSSGASVLATKAADTAVVNAIVGSTDFTGAVYTKTAAGDAFVKVDGTNISTQADKGKALVAAILGATDANAGNVKIVETELANTFVKTADLTESKVVSPIVGSSTFKAAVLNDGKGAPITGVDALVTAITSGNDKAKAVYTKAAAEGEFAKKDGTNVDATGVNIMLAKLSTDALKKPFAEAILGTKDGQKLVLVTKLADALDAPAKEYTLDDNSKGTSKAFLTPILD